MPPEKFQYRSRKSYEEMIDNCNNGNRRDAGKIGVAYGRRANDLLSQYQEGDLSNGLRDLVLLVEIIGEARKKTPTNSIG